MRRSSVYVATELSSHLTSQILMLFYVLTYTDSLLSNMKSLGTSCYALTYSQRRLNKMSVVIGYSREN